MIGFTTLLLQDITDKKQRHYLATIQNAGNSLLILIDDILDLSKIEAGMLEIQYDTIDIHVIIKEIFQIFMSKITEKNLEFFVDIDEALPTELWLDETRLRQVLFNLIGNAIKFTETGHIKLSIQTVFKENRKIDLSIVVTDTGILAAQQEIIFELFHQQDGQSTRKYGGNGLGLAISKRLVEMMNGHISLKSKVGKGSVFEIILRNIETYTVDK